MRTRTRNQSPDFGASDADDGAVRARWSARTRTSRCRLLRRSARAGAGSGCGWAGGGDLDVYLIALDQLGIEAGLWGRVVVGGSRWGHSRTFAVVEKRVGRFGVVVDDVAGVAQGR